MTGIQHKAALSRVEIKSPDRGEVMAIFSTFGVRDLDGDVVLREAIEDGTEVVISSYGHTSWGGALPVGKGRVRVTESEAILDGQFFLDTTAGRDTFTVVKELGVKQAWSFGFDVLDAEHAEIDGQDTKILRKLRIFEVSPVLLGAGINTRTLAAKALTTTDPAELAAAEYARFVAAELDRAVCADLAGIRADVDTHAELHRIRKACVA